MPRILALAPAALAIAAISCFGPPNAPVAGTLGPAPDGSGARAKTAFAVVFAGPRGTVTDLEQPAVTVLFNHAAHDPDADPGANLPALSIATEDGRAVAGAWQWVGTHGLLFAPERPLPGSSRFVVTVAAGARSLGGEVLAADYRFEFATARAAVEKTLPREGVETLRPDTAFFLEFNEPMDPEVVARAARLTVRTGNDPASKTVAVRASRPTTGNHPELAVILTPVQPLPTDSAVEIVLGKGLRGDGPLGTTVERTMDYRTYGPIRLADLTCPRTTGPRCQAHRDFTVVLSNAVDPDEFKAHFKAVDLPRRKAAPTDAKPSRKPSPSTEQRVAADPDFGKRYHLKLTAGMRDVFGQTLAKDIVFDVDTEAPFVAAGKVVAPGSANSAGASAPPPPAEDAANEDAPQPPPAPPSVSPSDPRPHRARLDYEVQIGLQGHVLEALAKQGPGARPAPHKVPIGAMNVPSYAMTAAKLREDEVLAWLDKAAGDVAAFRKWTWINPGAPENTRAVQTVDLDALLGGPGATARGAALLAVATPGSMGDPSESLVTVTDLGVTADMSRYGGQVWVTRLSDGTPVAGATVSVRKAGKGELFATTTDASGLATIPADRFSGVTGAGQIDAAAVLFVRKDDDWTYQRVERSQASYRSGVDVDLEQRGTWAGILYTDRGVYRPGETLRVSGVFRRVDAAGIKVVGGEALRLTVNDAQGEVVFDGRAQLDAFGALALDVPVPKTTHFGDARVTATVGRKDGDTFEQDVLFAAYKASEFKVAVDPDKKEYVRGDAARFDVHAEYLFGAPMGSASLHNHVSRGSVRYDPPHSEGFVTSDEANILDHPETDPSAAELRVDDGDLDEDGRYSAQVNLDLPRMRGPELVTFETEVEDLTHQTVAKRAAVRVHPAAFYLGVARPTSRFLAVGAPVPARIAAIDPQGGRVAGAKAKVELVRRTWTAVTEDVAASVPKRTSRVVDEVVGTCDVTTTAAAPASCPLSVREPGYYILRARAKDARGNDVGASTSFYALDDRSDAPPTVAWADPDARGLKLEVDKKQYEIGDTARILVRNPFKHADALVSVERGGVLWSRAVTLDGPMPVIEVPVTAQDFPNAFVAVHLVRGRVQSAPESASAADIGAPDFRLGIAPIEVNPESHRLQVKVTTDRPEYRPGDEVQADVAVTDHDGHAARGEVTFYAVDEGVLMLTGYQTPDPLPPFTNDQRLAVFSIDSRESLARILPLKNGERIHPLGYEFVSQPGDDKGGSGGGGGEAGGAVRADFKTTAYFDAGRVTSNEGRVHYAFKLPDNLTTFRLMAIVSGEDRFGAGEAAITTNRKLMVRPAMPRIVRAGDAFEAGVIVSSRDMDAAAVDVSLAAAIDGKGMTAGPATRRVQVPRGGSVEVRFPVKADVPGKATFEFAVAGGGEKDRVRVDRDVELPVDLETSSVYGVTSSAAAVALGDLKDARKDQGGLEVHVASTALVGLKTSFDRAIDYPYGCTEQLTSRILPLLVLPEMARLYGVRMPAKIEDVVDSAVGDLLTHQRDSGGFGFWDDDAVTPWLSAYAMLAVETAAKKGYFVPKGARDSGVAFLRQVLDHTRIGDETDPGDEGQSGDNGADNGESSDTSDGDDAGSDDAGAPADASKPKRAYATLAFVADVLAVLGQPDPGYLNRLFDARAHRPLFTQALLLHAMTVARMPAAEIDALVKEIEGRVRVDADSAYIDEADSLYADFLDSPSRTTALALRALVAARPADPLAPKLARGLLDHRVAGAWRSTQENVWALLALDDYRRAAEAVAPDFDARVFLGSDRIGEAAFHGPTIADQAIALDAAHALGQGPLTFQVNGNGRLFYSAELTYASATLPVKPDDQGLFVQKKVRALRPDDLAAAVHTLPKTSDPRANAGDLVLVDVILESAEPREQIVVDDPLPAGLEPIDFALETAAAGQDLDRRSPDPADADAIRGLDYGAFRQVSGIHREQHDDKVLTFIPHVDPGLYHFQYLARATTPGDFIVPPSRAEGMYAPDVRGRTGATRFTVAPAPPKPVRARTKS
ncbi:MAG TPA: MG2 domain-containing protein [Polyangiaceae bacterium]|nr:MG2 domain-containing protein [Polyangiaceae bacterium]